MPSRVEREYYRVMEVAEIMGVSRQAVYLMMQRGDIPHIKIGGSYFIPIRKFRKLLAVGENG